MPKLDDATLSAIFGLPPKAAIAYMQKKGFAITWNWQEMIDEAHARAATVAKVMRMDILQDIRDAWENAAIEGTTFEAFRDSLTPILQAKGWWGRPLVKNPDGVSEPALLGSPHRLETIYRTNLQSAYMAGRYHAMNESTDTHPYWMYVAVMDSRTRPAHRAMNGKVFRADDPIWDTFYPPNGFQCRCRVRPISEYRLKKNGLTVASSSGNLVTRHEAIGQNSGNPVEARRTGMVVDGIFCAPDAGFNYNPGKDWYTPFKEKS